MKDRNIDALIEAFAHYGGYTEDDIAYMLAKYAKEKPYGMVEAAEEVIVYLGYEVEQFDED